MFFYDSGDRACYDLYVTDILFRYGIVDIGEMAMDLFMCDLVPVIAEGRQCVQESGFVGEISRDRKFHNITLYPGKSGVKKPEGNNLVTLHICIVNQWIPRITDTVYKPGWV